MTVAVAISVELKAAALCAEGATLAETGDHASAIRCYQEAVAQAPALLDLHLILANAQVLVGRTLDARETLRHAVRVASRSDATAEFALGKALVDVGAGADAVPCFARARAAYPNDPAVVSALAAALREAQQPDRAWTEIQAALRLAPSDPVALLTAAMIRHDLADFSGALHWCNASLRARPDSSGARVTRAYLHFLLGDAPAGWHDFESRKLPRSGTAAKVWNGESLHGKTILIMGEQGVGDQFQFIRYSRHPTLLQASQVVVSCQPDAVSLLRAAGYDAISRDQRIETDFCVPLLSLPYRLGVDAEWDCGAAYLALPDWPPRPAGPVKRVGFVWAGNPAHRNDSARSMSFKQMREVLLAHSNVEFVCMQHDVRDGELPGIACEYSASGNWLATARELYTLDVLMTVDTGIAHLAGGLGVPVWLLVPHVPDWRWAGSGSQTPWYVTMRLFRQHARGDWSRVLTNVGACLKDSLVV